MNENDPHSREGDFLRNHAFSINSQNDNDRNTCHKESQHLQFWLKLPCSLLLKNT